MVCNRNVRKRGRVKHGSLQSKHGRRRASTPKCVTANVVLHFHRMRATMHAEREVTALSVNDIWKSYLAVAHRR